MAGNMGRIVAYLSLNSTKFVGGVKRAEARVNKFSKTTMGAGRSLMTGLTLPMALVGGAAAKMAVGFDQSMTKVETLVGRNRAQVDAWREDLLKIGPALGKTPQELSDALFFITSAGISNAKALDTLTMSAKASAVGLGETKVVADAVVSAMSAWKQQNLTAAQAADVLTATVRYGKVEATDLAGVLGRVTSTAAEMGVSFAEVGGYIAAFSRTGANAEIAATSLRGTLSSFLKPGEQAKKTFEDLGINIEKVRRDIADEGLSVALFTLLDGFDGNLDVLGKLIPNVRALAGVLAAAKSQGMDYIKIAAQIRDSEGLTQRAFERTTKTLAFRFDEFKAKVAVVGVVLGTELVPILLSVTDWIGKAADKMGKAEKKTVAWAAAGMVLAAVLAPLVFTVGALAKVLAGALLALSSIASIMAGLATVVGVVAGAFLLFAAATLMIDKESFTNFARDIPFVGKQIDWLALKIRVFQLELEKIKVVWRDLWKPDLVTEGGFLDYVTEGLSETGTAAMEALAQGFRGLVVVAEEAWGMATGQYASGLTVFAQDELSILKLEIAELENSFKEFWTAKGLVDAAGPTGEGVEEQFARITAAAEAAVQRLRDKWKIAIPEEEIAKSLLKADASFSDFFSNLENRIEDAHDITSAQQFTREIERGVEELTKFYKVLESGGAAGEAAIQKLADKLTGGDTALSAFVEHFKSGMDEIAEATKAAGDAIKINIGETFADTMDEMFTGFLRGTRDLESLTEVFSNSMIGILEDIFSQTLKSKLNFDDVFIGNLFEDLLPAVVDFAKQAISWLGNIFGAAPSITAGISTSTLSPGTAGGGRSGAHIWADGPDLHSGGIVSGPTRALVGDNPSGVEAIIPLERWKEVMGGGGGGINIQIHAPSAVESTKQKKNRAGDDMMEIVFEGAKSAVASDIYSGGVVSQAIGSTFGQRRRGGR